MPDPTTTSTTDATDTAAVPPADPPAGDHHDSGRDRLRAALLHPRRNQLVVAVLLAVVGFAGVVQVRTNDLDDSYSTLREQDLVNLLSGLAGTSQRARTEIDRLERVKRGLQKDSEQQAEALAEAEQQADTLSILAGLVPVTGPGIRITITEETGPVDIDSVLDAIEELRTSGAEAIQVNGKVRVVAQSSISDAVGGFSIDGTLLASPYVIDVIGDPHGLRGGMEFEDGPSDQLRDDGATVDIDELETLDIESVVGSDRPAFAQPD